MPIHDFKTSTAHYLQVRVKWASKERYAYVRVKRSRAVAMREAVKAEQKLLERRKAYHLRMALQNNYLHSDGKVIGIREWKGLQKKRSGIYPVHEFKCRIYHKGLFYFTSVSIRKHGYEMAYSRAIEYYCFIKDIPIGGSEYKLLMQAIDAYKHPVESILPLKVDEPDDFKSALEKEIMEFKRRNKIK